jgi:hypothetical protein
MDLPNFKSRHIEREIQLYFRERLQLLGQQAIIPDGILGEPVIGDHERFELSLCQVLRLIVGKEISLPELGRDRQ